MEMRRRIRAGRGLGGWEAERRDFYEGRGLNLVEVERKWEEGLMRGEDMIKIEKVRQERERWDRIVGSRSNGDYKFSISGGTPGYLKKGWSEDRWSRIARFRLGDVLKGDRYWESREERLCNVCRRELETWDHVWEICSGLGWEKGWQEMRSQVLGEEGQGENWLIGIEMLWGFTGSNI